LPSGESDVTCRTSEARIAAHLRAKEECSQEHIGERQGTHQNLEQDDKRRPPNVQSLRPTIEIKLHPVVMRDFAITPSSQGD
jgi:hypothetical protein